MKPTTAPDDHSLVFSQVSRLVLRDQPLGAVLQHLAELAAETIPGAAQVSFTLMEKGKPRSIAFSGDLARVLDERQYTDGFGPCMDAAATGELISIEDTAHETRYPQFAEAARRQGIQRVLAVGLKHRYADCALNVYSRAPDGVSMAQDKEVADTFAQHAIIAVVNASDYADARKEVAQMQEALTSRAVIEQAKGIVMRDRRCTPDEAFAVLRAASNNANRKVRDVAQSVVDEASGTLS